MNANNNSRKRTINNGEINVKNKKYILYLLGFVIMVSVVLLLSDNHSPAYECTAIIEIINPRTENQFLRGIYPAAMIDPRTVGKVIRKIKSNQGIERLIVDLNLGDINSGSQNNQLDLIEYLRNNISISTTKNADFIEIRVTNAYPERCLKILGLIEERIFVEFKNEIGYIFDEAFNQIDNDISYCENRISNIEQNIEKTNTQSGSMNQGMQGFDVRENLHQTREFRNAVDDANIQKMKNECEIYKCICKKLKVRKEEIRMIKSNFDVEGTENSLVVISRSQECTVKTLNKND